MVEVVVIAEVVEIEEAVVAEGLMVTKRFVRGNTSQVMTSCFSINPNTRPKNFRTNRKEEAGGSEVSKRTEDLVNLREVRKDLEEAIEDLIEVKGALAAIGEEAEVTIKIFKVAD